MHNEELLPCPFCGTDYPTLTDYGGIIQISCCHCPASLDIFYLTELGDRPKAMQLAESSWNSRNWR